MDQRHSTNYVSKLATNDPGAMVKLPTPWPR